MYTCQYKPYYTKEIKDEISGKTFKRCYYSIKDLREACHGAMVDHEGSCRDADHLVRVDGCS